MRKRKAIQKRRAVQERSAMRWDGQITVFLCLILTVIFSLLGACLESARGAGLRFRMQLAANSALQSVFAEFDRALWEQYRLLFCPAGDRSGALLGERVQAYAGLQGTEGGLWGSDWMRPEPVSAQVSGLVFATDQSGVVFEKAVLDYMETGAVEIVWEKLQETLEGDGSEAADPLQEARDSAEKGEFDFREVEEQYQEWEGQAAEVLEESQETGADGGTPGEAAESPAGEGSPAEPSGEQGDAGTSGAGETARESILPEGNLIEGVKALFSHGVLALVLENPGELSQEALGDGFLPSRMSGEERSRSDPASPLSEEDGVQGMVDTLLFQEYLLRFLDCYTSENPGEGLRYQLEYVVAGKENDRENLTSVVHRLLWVREAMNLAYLATDSSSRSLASSAAAALVGWTGLPFLVAGLSALILAAWSYGESLVDVRSLLAGECVPLLKDAESWRLSLNGLVSLSASVRTEEQKEEGLSYEDYLRLLLLTVGQEEKSYRAMDVIQRQMEQTEPGFRLDQCVFSCEATVQGESGLLFTPLLFLPRTQWGSSGYALEARTRYQY